MIRAFVRLGPLALLSMLAATACTKRVTYYRSPPITGLQFFSTAELTGPVADSLLVRVSARNDARVRRVLESGICGYPLVVRMYRLTDAAGRRATAVWDSGVWERARQRPDEVCLALAVHVMMSPGDSAAVASLVLPVQAVLGDSLPPGRYRLTAQLNSSGGSAGEINAGVIELRSPPAKPGS